MLFVVCYETVVVCLCALHKHKDKKERIMDTEIEPLTSEGTKNEEIDALTSERTNVASEDNIPKSSQTNEKNL